MARTRRSMKGTPFEREICKTLSLWWTDCARDDTFWRTSGSGARATIRSRSKKTTVGGYGDICAIDPIGRPLLDACTFELKRGYGKWSVMDMLDANDSAAVQPFEKFVLQVMQDNTLAGSKWPIIIARRDRRCSVIAIPRTMYQELYQFYGNTKRIQRHIAFRWPLSSDLGLMELCLFRLKDLLDWVDPAFFIDRSKENAT